MLALVVAVDADVAASLALVVAVVADAAALTASTIKTQYEVLVKAVPTGD